MNRAPKTKYFLGIAVAAVITLVTLRIYAQKEYKIQCTVTNNPYKKVFLVSVYGNVNKTIDSLEVTNSTFEFVMNDTLHKGMYRLLFNKNQYLNFIFNYEDVEIKTNRELALKQTEILQSKENKVFYEYLKNDYKLTNSLNEVILQGRKLYNQDATKNKDALDSLGDEAAKIEHIKREFALEMAKHYKNLFVSKIIKGMQVPSYEKYIQDHKGHKYSNRLDFLRVHYFDYIDFSDTSLLNTEVVYLSFSTYLKKYARPATTEGYINAVDMMLAKASANKEIYRYVLNLLLNTFENTRWNNVYHYITKNYKEKKDSAGDYEKKIKDKAEVIQKLTPGNKGPQITGIDVKGRPINLHEMVAEAFLVIFWSADCDHCLENMPDVKEMVNDYHDTTFKVIAVSIDADQMYWRKKLKELELLDWYNMIDSKGLESEVLQSYNIRVTPTFFLMDSSKTILMRTSDPKELKKRIKKLDLK